MAPVGPLLARLASEPLAMCQVHGRAALRALASMSAANPSDMTAASPARSSAPVAVVPVTGVLVRRGTGLGPELDAMFGITAFSTVVDAVRAAMADASVTGVVLLVDSPGGDFGGVLEAADAIRGLRASKPIVAFCDGIMASAAYALGAAASRVVASRSALLGSVGIMLEHEDLSAHLAMEGVKVDVFTAGARKADGHPAVPLSQSARADMQKRVDDCMALLCANVAASRGMKPENVAALEAGIFRGPDAVSAGLADEVGTIESATAAAMVAANTKPAGPRSPFGARAPWTSTRQSARAFA